MARMSDRRKGDRRRGSDRRGGAKTADAERRAGKDRRADDRRQAARRQEPRELVTVRVDIRSDENFLFAYATNVSSLGIFVLTLDPMPPGTPVDLDFGAVNGGDKLMVRGEVVWVNPYRPEGANTNPGMGIKFLEVSRERRELLIQAVRRIAYINGGLPGPDEPGQA